MARTVAEIVAPYLAANPYAAADSPEYKAAWNAALAETELSDVLAAQEIAGLCETLAGYERDIRRLIDGTPLPVDDVWGGKAPTQPTVEDFRELAARELDRVAKYLRSHKA